MGGYIDTIDSSLSAPALDSLYKSFAIPKSAQVRDEYALIPPFHLPQYWFSHPPIFPIADMFPLTCLEPDGNRRLQRRWTRTGFKIANSTRTSMIYQWLGTGMTCKRSRFCVFISFLFVFVIKSYPFQVFFRFECGADHFRDEFLGTCKPGKSLPCRYSEAPKMPTRKLIRQCWKPRGRVVPPPSSQSLYGLPKQRDGEERHKIGLRPECRVSFSLSYSFILLLVQFLTQNKPK